MPKVPTATDAGLGNVQTNVDRTPLQNFQTNVDQFGGRQGRSLIEAGQAIGQAGDILGKRALEMADQQAADDSLDEYNSYNAELRELTTNAQTGYYAQKGKNAIDITKRAESQITELRNKHENNLSSELAKRRFKALSGRSFNSTLDTIARHEARERNNYRQATAAGVIAGSNIDAVNNYTSPEIRKAKLEDIEDTIIEKHRFSGSPDEVLNLEIATERAKFHQGILEKMLVEGEPAMARGYYAANKKYIPTERRDKIVGNIVDINLQADPVKFRKELNEGAYKDLLTGKQAKKAAKDADTAILGLEKRADTQRKVNWLTTNQTFFDKLISTDPNNQLTMADLNKARDSGNIPDDLYNAYKKDLVKKSKVQRSPEERQQAELETLTEFSELNKKIAEGNVKLEDFIRFNTKVKERDTDGFLTTAKAGSYISKTTENTLTLADKFGGDSWLDAVSDFFGAEKTPFQIGFDSVSKETDDSTAFRKIKVFENYVQLYDAEPVQAGDKGASDKIQKLVEEAIKLTEMELTPGLNGVGGNVNGVVRKDGTSSRISTQTSDVKADIKIRQDFQQMRGKDGKLYRVFESGRVEEID